MIISEVSEKYGISQDTLRYYERIGLLPNVPRKSNNIRNYDEQSCDWVEFILCMRNAGMPIEALIEYVGLIKQGDETKTARKQFLLNQRDQMMARINVMQVALERLNGKLAHYDNVNENQF